MIALFISAAAGVAILPADVQTKFDQYLSDPRGAQYERVTTTTAQRNGREFGVTCGQFNAKNGYGAFVGFKPFAYLADSGGILYVDGAIVRSNGRVESIQDIMKQMPNGREELDMLSRRGDAILAEVRGALALCKQS